MEKIDRDAVCKIIFGEETMPKSKPKNIKAKEVTETIEKALEFYFANMENQ